MSREAWAAALSDFSSYRQRYRGAEVRPGGAPARAARARAHGGPRDVAGRRLNVNVALFGGTFDPVHRGHIVLAQEAQKQHELKQVHFVPAYVPPHKAQPSTAFEHRYAMLALATQGEKAFLPSLLESPGAAS